MPFHDKVKVSVLQIHLLEIHPTVLPLNLTYQDNFLMKHSYLQPKNNELQQNVASSHFDENFTETKAKSLEINYRFIKLKSK